MFAQRFRRRIEQMIFVLQFMSGEPVRVSVVQQCEIFQFATKSRTHARSLGKGAEFKRCQLMLPKFIEQSAEFLCETGAARAAVKKF